jgi:hypothetical protein
MTGGRLTHNSATTALGTLDPQGTATLTGYADATVTHQRSAGFTLTYAAVPSTGQFNLACFHVRTLAAGATESLNLFDGTFAGVYREATGFAKLKFISVRLIPNIGTAVTASSITIGNAAATVHPLFFGADTSVWTVYKNGPPLVGGDPATGITVDTNDKLVKVLNNDGSNAATYEIFAAGVSN